MTTPIQQSSRSSTLLGVNALNTAHTAILRCKNDVDTTAGALATSYSAASEDGAEFQRLLQQWDQQAQIILNKLQGLINHLNVTLQKHTSTQTANTDMLRSSQGAADSAYNQLTG
ncbi:hypothetical protein [Streptomyces heilongjiangensis]|uniref:WXG100 family type VII secretion target n=1 Tax=Streptomyces heilongjiangensis TaxID=945052 RepID=A0ABW1BAM9_9ACTN|nr:hypothetical protein [Streptomyces heilongjiangensis]MDC2950519.1 hypothetical protein [Streptomyces heilongjiangensis]